MVGRIAVPSKSSGPPSAFPPGPATSETGPSRAANSSGKVTISKDAAEGTIEIVATAAGKDAHVSIEVTSAARYDELLARSGLNAAGENDEAATATIASQSIGAGEGRVEDRARERRFAFLAIIVGVLLVLSIVTMILLRRSRRAKALLEQADERHAARVEQVLVRRRRREAEHAEQLQAHEESVRAALAAERTVDSTRPRSSSTSSTRENSSREKVCTSCGREMPASTAFCPHDGSALVAAAKAGLPYAVQAAISQRSPASRGKICPTCGERFEGAADFCGKDGTQLVLLN